MTGSGGVRKSTRERVPNKKYTNDVFEGLDIFSSDSEVAEALPDFDDSGQDEDFASEQAAEAEEESNTSAEDASDGSAVATPVEEFEDALSYASKADLPVVEEGSVSHGSLSVKNKHLRRRTKKPEKDLHSRGVPASHEYASKEDHLKWTVGTHPEDLTEYARSRDKWVCDATLPARKPLENGSGGMDYPFSQTTEQRESEATTAWDWYYKDGVRETIAANQNIEVLNQASLGLYWVPENRRGRVFLMGPYGNQKLFHLNCAEAIHLGEAWDSRPTTKGSGPSGRNFRRSREGWILNVGSKVQSLDWAPSYHCGVQYLAITTSQGNSTTSKPRSAFEPSDPYPTSVQIWEIPSTSIAGGERAIAHQAPRLIHLICNKWGSARQICWCHFPKKPREDETPEWCSVGLLAGVWSDGHLRVLDIRLDRTTELPTYVLYRDAAFTAKPSDTICTCLAWLSTSTIAAGCANGSVAIWDIASSSHWKTGDLENAQSSLNHISAARPVPHFYHSFHHTYILNIITCRPSLPHFLITSSMDGYIRLTDIRSPLSDIRSPLSDFVLSTRSRTASSALAYHIQLKGALAPEDNDFVRVLPIRRFFTSLNVARTEGQVSCIGAGKVHAGVLAGSTDGSVLATNPMRKGINIKTTQYQQIWFRHEWVQRQGGRSQDQDGNVLMTSNGQVESQREGISRFTEGYKVQSLMMSKAPRGVKKMKDPTTFSTIYEEETGITQLAWNPNLHFGGWAAAGMGSGLVRVEDLAI